MSDDRLGSRPSLEELRHAFPPGSLVRFCGGRGSVLEGSVGRVVGYGAVRDFDGQYANLRVQLTETTVAWLMHAPVQIVSHESVERMETP